MTAFTARLSRWRILLLFGGAVLLTGVGVWLAGLLGASPAPDGIWAGWIGMVFFGICAASMVPMLFDTDVHIRISAQGIFWKRWNDQTIPWSEISDIRSWELSGQKMVVLKLRDPSRFPGKGIQGLLAAPNRAITGGDISLVLTGTDQSADAALAAIRQYRR